MPSRWLMPSEKPLDRLPVTSSSPTMPMTSSTRLRGMSLVCARHSRWLYALRPPCTALASSSAPTSRIALYNPANGMPLTVTDPAVGRSTPSIIRIVVV
jgi:hypothetical protein